MMAKKRKTVKNLLAAFLAVGFVAFSHPLFAQGLPELPPEQQEDQPPLSPEDMIPQGPLPDEDKPDLGKDRNAFEKRQDALDKLFHSLKHTADDQEAAKLSRQIQGLWAQSGSDTVDLLMNWAEEGIRNSNYALAMDFLDNVVALKPDFAEGWMRRASVHAQMNDIGLAMFDLEKVLSLEPRHYNALFLLGMLMENTERKKLAIKAYEQAVDIYPQMRRAQQRLGGLIEAETDRAI